MADKKFEAILTLLVPQVVQLICENYPVDENGCIQRIL